MKYLLLAILAVLIFLAGRVDTQRGNAQQVSRPCDSGSYFRHEAATGPVAVVVGKPGARIYFCGFMFTQKGNTLDLIVSVGKGPDCAGEKIQITPQLELPADFALTNRIETGQPIGGPEFGLCIQTLGAAGAKLAGVIYYAQF